MVGLFSLTKEFIDSSYSPRPVISLVYIAITVLVFIFIFGVIYYYSFIHSQEVAIKTSLLYATPSPLWLFYYGIQGISNIIYKATSFNHILLLIAILFLWYQLLRVFTLINSTSYSKQQVKIIKRKLFGESKEIKHSEEKKPDEKGILYYINYLFELFLQIIFFPFALAIILFVYVLPWLLDLILHIILSTILIIITFLIVNSWIELKETTILSSMFNYFFTDLNIFELNYIEQLVSTDSNDFYFILILLLLMSWISFRQSGSPILIRITILLFSLSILILTAYHYGSSFGNKNISFWEVNIKQNEINLTQKCNKGCLLLSKSGNSIIVYDTINKNILDFTSNNISITFLKKRLLSEFP